MPAPETTARLHAYGRRFLLWALPALLLWWLSLSLLVPLLAAVADSLMAATYGQAWDGLRPASGGDWQIHTRLVAATHPDDGRVAFYTMNVGSLAPLSRGLPLCWALLLASSRGRWFKLLVGTLVMLAATVVLVTLQLSVYMTGVMSGDEPLTVYLLQDLQIRREPLPAWRLAFIETVVQLGGYVVSILIPALLAWVLNRAEWQPATPALQPTGAGRPG